MYDDTSDARPLLSASSKTENITFRELEISFLFKAISAVVFRASADSPDGLTAGSAISNVAPFLSALLPKR